MKLKARIWLRNLGAATITGGATTVMAALGIMGADALGAKVQSLDLKQVGILFVSGGVVGLLSYLKQSPLPPLRKIK